MTDAAPAHLPGLAVVLLEPEIPGNTGNIIRLCANAGAALHLVRPLGFSLEDRLLKRAGLDYHEYVHLQVHDDLEAARAALPGRRWIAFSAHGDGTHADWAYARNDVLLFGPETRGLAAPLRASADACLRIPMQPGVRSLNLSNAAAISLFEAWRQHGFAPDWCT